MVMTRGHIDSLIRKIHKQTPGKGMSDDVKAVIMPKSHGKMSSRQHMKAMKRMAMGGYAEGGQPAALSEGEYVVPADVVSMLGDGNSDAGAKILEQFITQIRKEKGKHLARGKQAPALT